MAELKTAEGRPVRDASLCPRCRPWPHHARAHPTAAIDLPDQPTRVYLFTGVVSDLGRRGGRRGGRGGLSPPPLRVDPGAAMLRMCCTPSGNNKRHLPRRATRLSVSPRWPARANAGKTASALRIADLKSTDSTCSSSSATWNDVRFELKHRARMGAT